MNLTTHDAPLPLDERMRLTEDVDGYAIQDEEGALWIPLIVSLNQGQGSVGRFLDDLPRDRAVIVPTVTNRRLKDMLHRRGFQSAMVLPPREDPPSAGGLRATRLGPWNWDDVAFLERAGVREDFLVKRDGWKRPEALL